jgi:hypothetical protein
MSKYPNVLRSPDNRRSLVRAHWSRLRSQSHRTAVLALWICSVHCSLFSITFENKIREIMGRKMKSEGKGKIIPVTGRGDP